MACTYETVLRGPVTFTVTRKYTVAEDERP
jgi:hypothetical protein